MGAPEGNQFWKIRSKHGRDTLFASPELLWEAACEYFTWCDDNPLLEQDFVGKDATEIHRNKMRPYTLGALCLYLGCGESYFKNFNLEGNPQFKEVFEKIRSTIYSQKFVGAASGFFNAGIISRDLGLKERTDTTSGDEPMKQISIVIDGKDIDLSK
jgi:hypothetical protein